MKTQQSFRSEKHNAFTEEINKIILSSSNGKRTESNDSIEICTHGTDKDLVCKKEEINVTTEDIKEPNPNWP